jgi:hypothetical protein
MFYSVYESNLRNGNIFVDAEINKPTNCKHIPKYNL